ncbi:MAG TPA: sodium:solute symporter [Cryomorphaceae bacterium]|nr:sodium:solute symporter [Cryomorphaceae bacterium]|tara:strand:- start:3224 stop:4639 length:1416 start_codon:yes stop_codon:yes gene_type:complete
MNNALFLLVLLLYVGLLAFVGRITSRGASNATFFNANKNANWLLVSFGMIGASLSGVTFISVPGWTAASGMTYMLMVVGYFLGYLFIASVLLPIYYKNNVISIYEFLGIRLGLESYRTGSLFFLLSRIVGAAARLYIVSMVVQVLICDTLGIPFVITALSILLLIAIYSASGGIATIVFTDTLQTTLMLVAAVMAFYFVGKAVVPVDRSYVDFLSSHPDWRFVEVTGAKSWWRQLLGGVSIAIAMTGLDQDMMQKNLTVKHLKDAQKNMVLLGATLLVVNLLFLSLGIFLTEFAASTGITATGDKLFSAIAMHPSLPIALPIVFFLGLLAAAFSSADSALTSLTTAFCIDFLGMKSNGSTKLRTRVYVGFMVLLLGVMLLIYTLKSESIISTLFTAAGYTYGPLVGLFSFALLFKRTVRGWAVLAVCVAAPLVAYQISLWVPQLGYAIGFELLVYNGLLTLLGLLSISKRA